MKQCVKYYFTLGLLSWKMVKCKMMIKSVEDVLQLFERTKCPKISEIVRESDDELLTK